MKPGIEADLLPLLIFEHIPKTAGSTMRHLLWQVYGGASVEMLTIPGEYERRLEQINKRLRRDPFGVRVIINHGGFGIHEMLDTDRPVEHFTILRDPVERTLSHYCYEQQQFGGAVSDAGLRDFVESDPWRTWNTQTVFLAGERSRWLPLVETCSEFPIDKAELVDRAHNNLRRCVAVGSTAGFDSIVAELVARYRWPRGLTMYRSRNVGKKRRPEAAFSPEVLQLVSEANELDVELFQRASNEFIIRPTSSGMNAESYWQTTTTSFVLRTAELLRPMVRPAIKAYRRLSAPSKHGRDGGRTGSETR